MITQPRQLFTIFMFVCVTISIFLVKVKKVHSTIETILTFTRILINKITFWMEQRALLLSSKKDISFVIKQIKRLACGIYWHHLLLLKNVTEVMIMMTERKPIMLRICRRRIFPLNWFFHYYHETFEASFRNHKDKW